MTYIPKWERLSDAVARVMAATGRSKDDAKTDICKAIGERAVEIRAKLAKHTTRAMRSSKVLAGSDFEIPPEIKPKDFDWEGSRPVKPWFVRRGIAQLAGYWQLDWIELSRADVTNLLCSGVTQGQSSQPAARSIRAKSRSRPTHERAERAIKELYPQGVPGQAAEPNASLCRRVGNGSRMKDCLEFQTTRS